MVKTFKNLLLQNWGCLGAESLHESTGTGGLPKLLKELSYVDIWPFYGKVKFASLCICMSPIHLNGKSVENFKRLLLWSLWANFVQISYRTTLGWGNKRLLKLSWSIDQDGHHAHIWPNCLLFYSSTMAFHWEKAFFSSPELCSRWAIVTTFRPSVNIFKRLLLWSRWANFAQISFGASLGWGNERLLKWLWSVDQDGRHTHIW